jgi:tRNA(Ile)-lysidine synthase
MVAKEKIIGADFDALKAHDKIAVAVSGGADSMALALLLGDNYANEIHALHVNHGLRAEAEVEATQVKQWLAQYGINSCILTPSKPINQMQGNLMQNARKVRYQLMQEYCDQYEINVLCVAHHAEDQVETLLMRLGRASGIDGLSSMKPKTIMGNLTILRPLLHCHKQQLIEYLQQQNQPWIEDPTNHNPKYTRTKMRSLIPILQNAGITSERINQTTQHLARAADFLQQHTQNWLMQNTIINETQIMLPIQLWLELHIEMQLRTLSASLRHIQPSKPELRYEKLESLRLEMQTPNQFKGRTLHHCIITKRQDYYIIKSEHLKK